MAQQPHPRGRKSIVEPAGSAIQLPVDIYARVSLATDKEQRSTRGQVHVCKSVLLDKGLPVGETFIDEGKSAWNPKVTRDQFETMMIRLETGVSGGVIVFDVERFSRQPDDGSRLIRAATRGLVVLDSDGDYDLTTASGVKAFRDALNAAEYYSRRLSDRVRRGKRLKAMEGNVDRRPVDRRSFGWEADNVTIRESEAAVIREMATRLLSGVTAQEVINELARRGVRTTGGRQFTQNRMREILLMPRSYGHLVHNDVVVASLPGDPILDADTGDRLYALYASRGRGRPPSPAYVCSGTAFCGGCGTRLAGRPRTNRKPYPDGEVRREYWCSPSSYGGCGRCFIDQRALDAEAKAITVAILSDPRNARDIEAAAARSRTEMSKLDEDIARDEETALRLAERLGRGEMDLAVYDAAAGPLSERLARLRAARDEIAGGAASTLAGALEAAGDWSGRWEAATPHERRALLRMALRGRRLIISPDYALDPASRITITH